MTDVTGVAGSYHTFSQIETPLTLPSLIFPRTEL